MLIANRMRTSVIEDTSSPAIPPFAGYVGDVLSLSCNEPVLWKVSGLSRASHSACYAEMNRDIRSGMPVKPQPSVPLQEHVNRPETNSLCG